MCPGSNRVAAILLATLATAPALAVELEPIQVHSRAGEPLRAEIAVVDADGAGTISARQPGGSAYARLGVARGSPALQELRFTVAEGRPGHWTIGVSTSRPVAEDFLTFLVEVEWRDGSLLREFSVALPGGGTPGQAAALRAGANARGAEETVSTVTPVELPDPLAPDPAAVVFDSRPVGPTPDAEMFEPLSEAGAMDAAAGPVTAPPIPLAAPAPPPVPLVARARGQALEQSDAAEAEAPPIPVVGAARNQRDSSAAPTLPTPATTTPAPPAAPAQAGPLQTTSHLLGPVAAGATLSALAAQAAPDVPMEAALVGLLLANGDAFIGGNINRLRQGATLRVPTRDALASIDIARARDVARLQEVAWRDPSDLTTRQALAAAMEDLQSDMHVPPAPRIAARPPVPSQSRLEILPGTSTSPDDADPVAGAGPAGVTAVGAEALATRDLEVRHLRERVEQLERLNAEQRALIALQDSAIGRAQGAAAGQRNAATSLLGRNGLWAGLATLLALTGLAWMLWRGRRRAQPPAATRPRLPR